MRWRVLVWVTCAIAGLALAGLIADLAVAGLNQAAAVSGVIAGVAALAALVIAVADLPGGVGGASEKDAHAGDRPGEKASGDGAGEAAAADGATATPGPPAGQESHPPAGKFMVDARNAGNVQVGDWGVQHIHQDRSPRARRPDEDSR